MDYTHLGRSGATVSRICLGTMNFGAHTEPDDAHQIMDHALEEGINFFDTRMDQLEDMAVLTFLGQVGDAEVMDRRYVPGEDHSAELSDVYAALEDVRAERDRGEYSYAGGIDDYRKRTARLSARLAELEAKPSRPAGFELVPTGKTFGEKWEELDTQGRRRLMLGAGFEIRAAKTTDGFSFSFRLDPELAARVQAVASGAPVSVPDHAELQAAHEVPALATISGDNADDFMANLERFRTERTTRR